MTVYEYVIDDFFDKFLSPFNLSTVSHLAVFCFVDDHIFFSSEAVSGIKLWLIVAAALDKIMARSSAVA